MRNILRIKNVIEIKCVLGFLNKINIVFSFIKMILNHILDKIFTYNNKF